MRSRLGRMIFLGTICLGILGSSSLLLAKKGSKSSTGSKTKPAQTHTPTPAPSPETPTTSPSQQGSDEVQKAEAALQAAESKAKKKFETTPEWTAAQDAVSKAQGDVDAANIAVGARVRSQPDYIEAAANVKRCDDKLQQTKDNSGSGDEIAAAATELMTARSTLGSVQSKAGAGDPTVVAAGQKLADANLVIEHLRKSETAAVQADSDWQTAKKAYDDAKSKLASARK